MSGSCARCGQPAGVRIKCAARAGEFWEPPRFDREAWREAVHAWQTARVRSGQAELTDDELRSLMLTDGDWWVAQ